MKRTRTIALVALITLVISVVAVAAYEIHMSSSPSAFQGLSLVSNTGLARFPNGSTVRTGLTDVRGCYCVLDRTDWAVSSNGTRVLFNPKGVIATIYPFAGTEIFSNGTSFAFSPCQYQYPTSEIRGGGLAADGTAAFSYSNGMTVYFFANGTCSES